MFGFQNISFTVLWSSWFYFLFYRRESKTSKWLKYLPKVPDADVFLFLYMRFHICSSPKKPTAPLYLANSFSSFKTQLRHHLQETFLHNHGYLIPTIWFSCSSSMLTQIIATFALLLNWWFISLSGNQGQIPASFNFTLSKYLSNKGLTWDGATSVL